MLVGASESYNPLGVDPENKSMIGEDKYPTSIIDAYNMMLNWKITDTGLG